MKGQMRRHTVGQLRDQWAGFLAIVLLLGVGTAHALPGTNTVFTDDIVDGEVRSADVADDSLGGSDVRRLSGGDVADDTLGTGQVDESSLGIVPVARQAASGRANQGGCEESTTYVDCGDLAVHLAKPGRLLIIASVHTHTSSFVRYVRGSCRLEVGGAPIETSATRFNYDDEGEVTPLFDAIEGAGQSATLTAVSHVYPTGRQVVGVECALNGPGRAANGEEGHAGAYVDVSAVALSHR